MHDHRDRPSSDSDRERQLRLSAEALGQLNNDQRHLLEDDLAASQRLRGEGDELLQIADALSQHAAGSLPAASPELREAILSRLAVESQPVMPAKPGNPSSDWSRGRMVAAASIAVSIVACLAVVVVIPLVEAWNARLAANNSLANDAVMLSRSATETARIDVAGSIVQPNPTQLTPPEVVLTNGQSETKTPSQATEELALEMQQVAADANKPAPPVAVTGVPKPPVEIELNESLAGGISYVQPASPSTSGGYPGGAGGGGPGMGGASAPGYGYAVPSGPGQVQDHYGATAFGVTGAAPGGGGQPLGYGGMPGMMGDAGVAPPHLQQVELGLVDGSVRHVTPQPNGTTVLWSVDGAGKPVPVTNFGRAAGESGQQVWYQHIPNQSGWSYRPHPTQTHRQNQEYYAAIVENPFVPVSQQALSTLSIDVDTASYANVRRFLSQSQMPPANAVRIEELINYFSYDYPAPQDGQPFTSHLEVAQCPWQPKHRLVRVGLQGKTIAREKRPACNLVFLLDVSGSMKDANKLPLLKQAMKLLVGQLDENDRVAIVTYASQAGVRLKSTVADKHDVIHEAINGLQANGSTNGGAGIQMAYEQALAGAVEGGVNRVILATDGDLNVGITDDDALVRLIKEKAADDVFLTVLGFGEGNLQDAKLEKLADNGNGVYAYIDNLREARKVLVEQVEGSLVTIAKDVKIKVEFNPAEVQAYRLIGYENRLMTAAEFNDDKKDAGEIGAGHCVTAIYELVPAAPVQVAEADGLKYQQQQPVRQVPAEQLSDAAKTGELLTLSLRYKLPDEDESKLIEVPLLSSRKSFSEASPDFRFATAVASFGMLLRNSVHRGDTSFAAIEEIAAAALGDDENGYRTEFLDLVRKASGLK